MSAQLLFEFENQISNLVKTIKAIKTTLYISTHEEDTSIADIQKIKLLSAHMRKQANGLIKKLDDVDNYASSQLKDIEHAIKPKPMPVNVGYGVQMQLPTVKSMRDIPDFQMVFVEDQQRVFFGAAGSYIGSNIGHVVGPYDNYDNNRYTMRCKFGSQCRNLHNCSHYHEPSDRNSAPLWRNFQQIMQCKEYPKFGDPECLHSKKKFVKEYYMDIAQRALNILITHCILATNRCIIE